MDLVNEFSMGLPIDEAWAILTDLERVAPCMPGFELQGVDGEEYRGAVRVKVGPVVAQYKGVASFQERDAASHRAVIRAEGREARGQGNAAATVTATLVPGDSGTKVTLHTHLTITGKVAQFGRGVLADVSGKLLRQFVEALEADVLAGPARGEPAASDRSGRTQGDAPAGSPATSRRIESTAGQPVDLLATAGASVLRRVAPIAAALALVALVVLWLLLRR